MVSIVRECMISGTFEISNNAHFEQFSSKDEKFFITNMVANEKVK